VRPSSLLGISTDQAALAFDIACAMRAEQYDIKEGTGDYWWLSVLKAFGKDEEQKNDIHWF
jgi:hypothetical protein